MFLKAAHYNKAPGKSNTSTRVIYVAPLPQTRLLTITISS